MDRSKSVIAPITGDMPDPTVTGDKNRVNLIWAPYISTVQLSRRIDRGEANRAGVKSLGVYLGKLNKGKVVRGQM